MVDLGVQPTDERTGSRHGDGADDVTFDVMLRTSDVRKAFLALRGARLLLSTFLAAITVFAYLAISAARTAEAGRGFAFWLLASFFVWLVARMLYFQPREALDRFGHQPISVRITTVFVEMAQPPSYSRFGFRDLIAADEDPDAFLLRTAQRGVIVLPKRTLPTSVRERMRAVLRAQLGLRSMRFRPETLPFALGGTAAVLLYVYDLLP